MRVIIPAMNKTLRNPRGWRLCLLGLLWLTASGCQTYQGPPEENLAVVTVANRTLAEVQAAVIKVFTAHGFSGGASDSTTLEFFCKGGRMDRMIYGSYLFTDTVSRKVAVTMRAQPNGDVVLTGSAWIVEAEENPVFTDDRQVHPLRKGPYQKMLEEAKEQR